MHSYTVSFWWATAIFAAGAVISAIVLRPGVPDYGPAAATSGVAA